MCGSNIDQLPASYNPSLHFLGEQWFLTKPSGDNGRISVIKSGAYIIYKLQTMVILFKAPLFLHLYSEVTMNWYLFLPKPFPKLIWDKKSLACLVWAYWHWFAVEWSLVEGTQCGIIIIRPSSRIPIHPWFMTLEIPEDSQVYRDGA